MALITRFTRLFRADLHAVLDRVEEPDILLKQAVREMEEDTARDEHRIKIVNHELAQISARQSDLEASLEQIGAQMDVCFSSGKEDLARALIKRKLEALQLQKVLSRKQESVRAALGELKARLADNGERLQAMRQKAELLAEEHGRDRQHLWVMPHVTVRDEDVEVAFLREKQIRSAS